jgi:MFS family permease
VTTVPADDGTTASPDIPSAPARKPGLRDAFAALKHRNFALFWTGALLSNSGTWIQTIAIGYVVNEITHSAALVSIASFLQFLPIVVLGPWGGSLADRYDRRTILLVGQTALGVLALVLWLLWVVGDGSLAMILGISLVSGFVNGAVIPSWQAFVSELVPREALLNAVTLNSTQFNGARAFGPALGGFVLATGGPGAAFLLNALSYATVVGALVLIRTEPREKAPRRGGPSAFVAFADAVRYARNRPGILTCFIVVAALGGLGSPYLQLMPYFATNVFLVGAIGYGFLQAGLGIGSLVSAPFIAGPGTALARSRLVSAGMVSYGISMVVFGATSWFVVGMVALLIGGAGYLCLASTLNTTIQLQVDEVMRGKVLACYVMLLTASLPVGLVVQTLVVAVVGPQITTILFAVGFLAVFAWARFGRQHLARLDDDIAAPEPTA